MNRLLTFSVVAAFLYPLAVNAVTHSTTENYAGRGVAISLQDPIGSVYQVGEEVGFSVRTDKDAYVIVFDIDTDGFVHLLYPADGKSFHRFSSQRSYSIPEYPGESLVVGGAKGLEFVFALAIEDRDAIDEDEVHFLARSETLPEDRKFRITGDPFLGANRVMSQLVRGASLRRDVTISFTYFYVGEAVDFPRYLCEDCYEKGKDPYATGMPTYVANADFEITSGLAYPLTQGFVGEYAASTSLGLAERQSSVTKVYVSYYPRWDTGFYSTSWWYLDPWYWSMWYWDPWYPPYSGFYVGVGWNWGWWGWGACHYRYFPYYYCGPYYACRPGWGYYSCYPDYYWYGWYGSWYYPPYTERWRSFGVTQKGQGTRRTTGGGSVLHTAMKQRVSRDYGLAQRSVKPPDLSARRVATARTYGTGRSVQSLKHYRPDPGPEARVIRSRPTRSVKARATDSRGSREVRSQKGSYREQRVITRPPTRSFERRGARGVDTRGLERRASEFGRRIGAPSKSPSVVPKSTTRKSESRGVYKPNVRRGGGGKSASPRATTGRSSGRSSPSSSKATSSSRGGSRRKG